MNLLFSGKSLKFSNLLYDNSFEKDARIYGRGWLTFETAVLVSDYLNRPVVEQMWIPAL